MKKLHFVFMHQNSHTVTSTVNEETTVLYLVTVMLKPLHLK